LKHSETLPITGEKDKKMSAEQIIREAIDRSIEHNSIEHCEVDGFTSGDLHSLLIADQDWDYSEENRDERGREVLDVYSTEEGRGSWRIKITFNEGA